MSREITYRVFFPVASGILQVVSLLVSTFGLGMADEVVGNILYLDWGFGLMGVIFMVPFWLLPTLVFSMWVSKKAYSGIRKIIALFICFLLASQTFLTSNPYMWDSSYFIAADAYRIWSITFLITGVLSVSILIMLVWPIMRPINKGVNC